MEHLVFASAEFIYTQRDSIPSIFSILSLLFPSGSPGDAGGILGGGAAGSAYGTAVPLSLQLVTGFFAALFHHARQLAV
jgi:hypothetical protein